MSAPDPETGSTVRWRDLLREASERLSRAGLDSAETDARRIIESSAGVEPVEFHPTLDEPASERGVARFDALVARRESGEPLQYVVGRWAFRTLDLHLDDRVLIPRPETEMVAGLAVAEVQQRSADRERVLVADLGTGSGAIGLSVAAECPRALVVATDVSSGALAVTRANLAGLGRAATRVTTSEGSWFEALDPQWRGRLDVIVANPPYISDDEDLPAVVADWEPPVALRAGPVGTEAVDCLITGVGDWMDPGGVFVVELAPHQVESMSGLARDLGYAVSVHADLVERERALVLRR